MVGQALSVRHALAVAAIANSLLLPSGLSAVFPSWNGIGPQVTPELSRSSPKSTGHLLAQDVSDPCSPVTPLIVDPAAYKDRCSSPRSGPCFQIVGASMQDVSVDPWYDPIDNMTDAVILADDSATAFAMKDPTLAFEIDFLSYGDLKFRYLNYDADTNCYDVTLERKREKLRKRRWRMSVGETKDDRDLDTLNSHQTSTQFCTDNLVINIRRQPRKKP